MDQPVPKYGYLALSCSSRRQTMYQTVPSQGEWMNADVTEGVGGRKRRACSGGLEHFAAQLVQGVGGGRAAAREPGMLHCAARFRRRGLPSMKAAAGSTLYPTRGQGA